jgi:gustatory receptor
MSDTMVEKNSESKISTLTSIIGMFIIYLEPLMMTIDIMAALINQTALIDVFDRLQEIDDKLEKENVYLDNRKNRFTSIMFLTTFMICEIGIGFAVVFIFREEFSIIQSLLWFISCVPLSVDLIAKTWFLMLILLVQSRLRAINTYLNDIKRSFQERKLRHVKTVESKQPLRKDNLFMESVGYLETEIYSTASDKIDGWNYWEGARNNKTNKVGDVNSISGVKSMKKIIQVAPYKGQ